MNNALSMIGMQQMKIKIPNQETSSKHIYLYIVGLPIPHTIASLLTYSCPAA